MCMSAYQMSDLGTKIPQALSPKIGSIIQCIFHAIQDQEKLMNNIRSDH